MFFSIESRILFPEIVRRTRIKSPGRAKITFNIVYDACYDYKSILASGRQEANRKKLISRKWRSFEGT